MVISAVFLLLNIPTEIFFLGQGRIPNETPQDQAIEELFYCSASLLYYLNSSLNFLMYFVSGAKFRQAARSTVTGAWCCKRSHPSFIYRTTHTALAVTSRVTDDDDETNV
jgi:hypothetical protein